jgi:soluble P-type ATPase
MIELVIPGFGDVQLKYLVTDFTGTLSIGGKLYKGVSEKIDAVSKFLKVYILTADTFGTAIKELEGKKCEVKVLSGENIDIQKEQFVKNLGAENVIAFGNGLNDRLMLKVAKIGVLVVLDEGCSTEALLSSKVVVKSPLDAFDLILDPKRLKATLRF